MITRSRGLVSAWVAIWMTALPMCSGARGEEITVLTWGGAWEHAANAIAARFQQLTTINVNVQIQENMRFGLAKLKAQRNDPQVDIWFSVPDGLQEATDAGLLQQLSADELPTVRSLPPSAHTATWVDVGDDVYGIIYRKDLVPLELKTFDDVLDARLKGKVLLPTATYASGYAIVAAALPYGGDENNVGPGFDYMLRLKPNIDRFYTTGPAAMKLLQTGESTVALFGLFANMRPYLDDPNFRFALPPGRVVTTTYAIGMPSAKNKAAAMKFVDFLATSEAQTLYCASTMCIPTNPAGHAPPAVEAFKPDPSRLYRPSSAVVSKNLPAWNDRFKKEIQTR